MKIEKVNDNQIRCTLTKEDLACRSLKISELAYGTQKAKDLFRDMMQQASFEFGFEAEDIPLMIEAIPFSEYVVLIITKVEDPEELDTRFSKFAPSNEEDEDDSYEEGYEESDNHTQDVLDLFKKIKDSCDEVLRDAGVDANAPMPSGKDQAAPKSEVKGLMQAFNFNSMSEIIRVAHIIGNRFTAPSSVYVNESTGEYLLLVKQGDYAIEQFAKVCNFLSEYATLFRAMNNAESYLEEHYSPVCVGNALETLSQI